MDDKIHIAMVGAGYVGLITSACFAELGYKVICTDKDQHKIKALQNGDIPIHEPDLNALIHKNLKQQTLHFSDSLFEAILNSNIIFIAIGTPPLKNGDIDVSQIESAIKSIAPLLTEYKIIVIKSTVPIGTGHKLSSLIRAINCNAKFSMVTNPEFLRAGSGIKDFMIPDRIIVGLEDSSARSFMDFLYQPLTKQGIPIFYTSIENSELIKYVSNCFLATKIAFANEVADLCEKLGTNATDVLYGMGLDKRIGNAYFQPGPGFGGSCLTKDAQSLVNIAKKNNSSLQIIESVLTSNKNRRKTVINKIIAACNYSVSDKRLAILGLSFKANTDDIRESATLSIILELQSLGAELSIYDPIVKKQRYCAFVWGEMGKSLYDTISNVDAIVIMTEWDEFRRLDMHKVTFNLRNTLMAPTLIDLRNLYDPAIISKFGILYVSVGQSTPKLIQKSLDFCETSCS